MRFIIMILPNMDTTSIKTGDLVLTGVVIEGLTLNSISPVVSRKVDCWLWDDGSVILWDDGLYMSKDNQNE